MFGKMTMFERRLEELFFIANRRQTSIFELASYFSVSRDTILRDVVFLSRYAPIYTRHGIYGGIFIVNDYENSIFPYLSQDEKLLLEKVAQSLADIDAMRIKNVINKFSMPDIPSST